MLIKKTTRPKPTEGERPFLSRLTDHLANLAPAIAEIWAEGRVAYVAFELDADARKKMRLPSGATVWTVERAQQERLAERCDAVTAKFVDGKRPGRVWLWYGRGGSLLLTHITGEGWQIVPGSTDAERIGGMS